MVNVTVINVSMQKSLWSASFDAFGDRYSPRNDLTGSCNSIPGFLELSLVTGLVYIPQGGMGVSFHAPFLATVGFACLTIAVLTGVR
jgi:hypothetical protein